MAVIPRSVIDYWWRVEALRQLALKVGRKQWSQVDPQRPGASWASLVARNLVPTVSGLQRQAALEGSSYAAYTLALEGDYDPPDYILDPDAFVGVASFSGKALLAFLLRPGQNVERDLAVGWGIEEALERGLNTLERLLATEIADTARDAAALDIAARPRTGYVRMCEPTACALCVLLAGHFYRWNDGFERHPYCRCTHVPTTVEDFAEAYAHGYVDDKMALFTSLSEEEQDRRWGRAAAEAIRNGADMSQVMAALNKKYQYASYRATRAGMKHGYASRVVPKGRYRLTPQEMLKQAGGDRAKLVDLLRANGYIVPASEKRAKYGFGPMGGGGARRAASDAVRRSETHGREFGNRYTMTSTERALWDRAQTLRARMDGYGPASPPFGQTSDPTGNLYGYGRGSASGQPNYVTLSPMESAKAEMEYRELMLAYRKEFYRIENAAGKPWQPPNK